MKILYLSLAEIPSRAAHSIHIMRMCNAIAQNGHCATLEVPHDSDDVPETASVFLFYGMEESFDLKFRKTSSSKARSTRFLVRALREFSKEGGDLVYTREVSAAFWAVCLGIPTILETHGLLRSARDKFMFSVIQNSTKLKRHVVISERLRLLIDQEYPKSLKKRFVAHDGADHPSDSRRGAPEPHLAGTFKVGYVGHLYGGRGLELIADLAGRIPSAMFYIVGGMEEDIANWREKFDGRNNLKLLGHLSYSQAEQVRLGCDVLLAPYQRGLQTFGGDNDTSGWMSPLKIFEYMAAGKPILCSDFPSIREILRHGETGFLIDPLSVDQWTEALEVLQRDETLRKKVGAAARREFNEKYEWKVRARKILSGLPTTDETRL